MAMIPIHDSDACYTNVIGVLAIELSTASNDKKLGQSNDSDDAEGGDHL